MSESSTLTQHGERAGYKLTGGARLGARRYYQHSTVNMDKANRKQSLESKLLCPVVSLPV